jgi:phospholipase C
MSKGRDSLRPIVVLMMENRSFDHMLGGLKKIVKAGQHDGIGFNFDRLGPRVPAVIVSAYTKPQTHLHDIFEHTSVLSTVVNCFD